jgi:eukaryotic-like serine/threonine-protein kinase
LGLGSSDTKVLWTMTERGKHSCAQMFAALDTSLVGSRSVPSTNPRLEPQAGKNEISQTFPPELMAEASRRLGWLGLLYCSIGLVAHFGTRALLTPAGPIRVTFHYSDLPFLAAAALGLALYVASRRGLLPQKHLLALGLVFQVVGALGIAASRLWTSLPASPDSLFGLIPAECILIMIYPLVVPNPPRTALIASLLTASTGPAVFAVSATVNGMVIDRPELFFFTSNYMCAFLAYVISRMMHSFGVRLRHAREIGSYELVDRIGEGGMGEVWRAKHRLLARPAAIKLIRRDVLGSSQRTHDAIVQRFEREARDTAALGSVHTVDIFDFGITEDGDFYYVMELLDGLSLEQFVKTFGPMEPARVVYLLRQVTHSLGEAHARGLLHRDVKPANIFMCRLGPDEDFVKVLDFGLVKHFETPEGSMLTMEGATAGTPAYMAPEIALGRPGVDGRADIYSLGCVAYYLLTGYPVFTGETPVATALAHVNEAPVPPSERSEFKIPSALEALILECLAKDPAQRPRSAAEVGERLAATIPTDTWTRDQAHAWWELHYAQLSDTGEPTPAERPAIAVHKDKRCWPKLDRRRASEASVAPQ